MKVILRLFPTITSMKISSNKIYKLALVLLILINGALVFLLLQNAPPPRPGPKGHGPLLEKITAKLELTEDQRLSYSGMALGHRENMRMIEKEQKRLITSYFQSLMHTTQNQSNDSLVDQILKQEQRKLEITYAHFEELKTLLDEKQKDRFELIMKDILKVLVGEGKKLPPPPRDR